MECRFIMRSPPTRIHIDAPAMDAVNLMVIKHMQNLPVVDHEERFLGEIGVQGILGRMLPLGLTEHPESNRLNFLRETLDDLRDKFHTIVDLPISEIMDKDVPRVAPDNRSTGAQPPESAYLEPHA
ncbi:MAG: hypothetical protein U9N14_04395, partial [Pseudomonadota bacterium]|nr:hypothetical protein [Pseudomonadota bacterium]